MRKIAIFGGSFNPPCSNHQIIARILAKRFDEVVIVPCGARKDKNSVSMVRSSDRGVMAKLAFDNLSNVSVDLFDLKNNSFTPTYFLQERYQKIFSDAQIWHVVGGDIICGGKTGKSEIHRVWHEGEKIWNTLRYAIIKRLGYVISKGDMPPRSELLEVDVPGISSTIVRERVREQLPIDEFVDPKVKNYIEQQGLYK